MEKRIAVIGAGPGGYVAAIRAAQLGCAVTLIEKDRVGGTCLNRGCIPTKTLFKTAELAVDMRRSAAFGIEPVDVVLDGKKIMERKNEVVEQVVSGVEFLLKSYKNLTQIDGVARFKDKNTLIIETEEGVREEEFDAIIIATGSYPQMTETQGVDLPGVLTSDDLLAMDDIPESMIVVGGGVIGLEFASIYQELGCQVILLASRILKDADMEIRKRLPSFFKRTGMEVYVDVRALQITQNDDGSLTVDAKYKTKDKTVTVTAKNVLIASGRGPVIDTLGLEEIGVEFDRAGILVDENLKTSVDGIYAIGDVVSGNPQLAHVASAHGVFVAELLAGEDVKPDFDVYPSCSFTLPEVAQVGMTEWQVEEAGIDYVVSKFLFAANAKAVSIGDPNGFVKVIATKDLKKILGVHIMGPHANDLITEGVIAMQAGLTVDELIGVIHAHPTLSEAVMETIHGLKGVAVHMVR